MFPDYLNEKEQFVSAWIRAENMKNNSNWKQLQVTANWIILKYGVMTKTCAECKRKDARFSA